MNRRQLTPSPNQTRRPFPFPPCSDKQRGDAAEYLIAGMMILADMPAARMPDNWPGFDLMAVPPYSTTPLKISVKGRADPIYVVEPGDWDWLAFVWTPKNAQPRFWLIPKQIAMPKPRVRGKWRLTLARLDDEFRQFENNFRLCPNGLELD